MYMEHYKRCIYPIEILSDDVTKIYFQNFFNLGPFSASGKTYNLAKAGKGVTNWLRYGHISTGFFPSNLCNLGFVHKFMNRAKITVIRMQTSNLPLTICPIFDICSIFRSILRCYFVLCGQISKILKIICL